VATTNKDFRIKNGLVVEGATSTVNGNQVLTTASSLDSLSDVVITTPTTSQVLSYNGTNWINSSSGGGGTTTNPLTIGTGLSGTSFDGSAAVTIAIDSTVATTSGTQTLTNKTINLSNNTLTATSAQIASAVTDETGSGALVFGTAPTLTAGVTIIHTAGNTLFTFNNDQNGNMEIGRIDGVASTPYLDFHSGATAVDFDSRLIFSGGTGVSGGGTMNIITTSLQKGGVAIPTISSTDTLTNKTLTSPTLTTPSIGVATGTSFNSITGLSSTTPSANGTAAVGTATTTARADHVHPTATVVSNTVTGTNSADLVLGSMADNDNFRIRIGGTATNTGFVEIATADDGTEPIHIRQYTGAFATLTRTATLLDASGNTVFPGTVSASGLAGSLLTSTVGTALGTAAAGTATVPARADHVHPNTAATAAVDTNTTQIATTAYVVGQGYAKLASPTFTGTPTLPTGTILTTPSLTLSTTSSTTEGRIAWDSTNDKILVGGTLNGTAQTIQFASSTLTISTPTFTTNAYTVVLTDKDKWLELSNGATAGTLNIPTDASVAFPIGTQINIIQTNTGQITIAAVTPGTTTVNGTPGLKLRGQWSSATIIKRAANSWVAVGDLSA
jgi:hypothetical protein